MSFWQAQPGPQAWAVSCPADMILFGGSRGPGKTEASVGCHIVDASKHGINAHGMLIRRKYKDFAKIRGVFDRCIAAGLPATRVGGENQVNYVRYANGAVDKLQAMNHANMADDEQGNEYSRITFDDAGTMPHIGKLVNLLKATLRSSVGGVDSKMFLTANPGGPGHGWLKQTFIDNSEPLVPSVDPQTGLSKVFIPADVYDNPLLMKNDPKYIDRLMSIDDPVLRRAWIEGDWSAFAGQALEMTVDHQIKPIPVPEWAQIVMTFDWGWSHPFSIGWWWVDANGRLYRFNEWYGWSGVPDEGCRMADSDIAIGIRDREERMGIAGRPIIRLAGPDSFSKRPNTRDGGHLPAASSTFAQHGVYLRRGNPDRISKIRQFRERLRVKKSTGGKLLELPMMLVYDTCKQFIRTIPTLAMGEDTEDVDTDQEDHAYDEAGLICNHYPIRLSSAALDQRERPEPIPQTSTMEEVGTENSVLES